MVEIEKGYGELKIGERIKAAADGSESAIRPVKDAERCGLPLCSIDKVAGGQDFVSPLGVGRLGHR
jgi:hypothetical protein